MSRFDFAALPGALSRTAFLAGLALVLLACGSGESKTGEKTRTGEAASASADTIRVTMKDYAYQPSSITVPAGQKVTLKFKNTGTVEHYFVVGDTIASSKDGFRNNLFSGVSITKTKNGTVVEGGEHPNEFELHAGESGSITFTLPPPKAGTYTIACFATTSGKKHYQMGMRGTLTVTAPTNQS